MASTQRTSMPGIGLPQVVTTRSALSPASLKVTVPVVSVRP